MKITSLMVFVIVDYSTGFSPDKNSAAKTHEKIHFPFDKEYKTLFHIYKRK
jgi:hypothetical protein